MSYIYEALLRAERERQSNPSSLEDQKIAPAHHEEIPAYQPMETSIAPESIAQHEWNPFIPSFPTLAKHGRGLEQFRSLRSHIYQARNETPLKTILISSGMPSEGKSFVTANLAMSLARNSSNQILLIDGDLRRPSLNHLLGAPNEVGLSDYLAGTAELHEVMQRCSDGNAHENSGVSDLANLTFIPTGTLHENASELITNQRIKDLISRVSALFDWVLIDTPPVLVFSDAVDLARAVDAVLLVVRGAQTTYEVAQRAKSSFTNSRILGVVLNDIKNPPRRESYYNYYYYGKQDTAGALANTAKQEGK
jgi:capsular exopolysaccharide synthesis family protein